MCFSHSVPCLPLLAPLAWLSAALSVKCVLSFGQVARQGEYAHISTFPHFSPTFPMANFLARCEFYEQVCNEISVSCGRHFVYWQHLCPTLNIASLKLLWVSFVRVPFSLSSSLSLTLSGKSCCTLSLRWNSFSNGKQNNWKSKSYLSYGKTIVFLFVRKVCETVLS